MPPRVLTCLLPGVLLLAASAGVRAEEAGEREFFERRIRPVLVEHCYECHSAASNELQGGLLLDHREAMRAGGDSGPAIVAGETDEGTLLDALRHGDYQMPPGYQLPEAVIADFEQWIAHGAIDPREPPASEEQAVELARGAKFEQLQDWWSLQPPALPDVPTTANSAWSSQPIDRFILARLEVEGLAPAERADRRTLLRRASFALTGLPPTPAEVDAYLADTADGAWQRQVDRLLASPHFGERFARHWMDVVRYSDTYGYEWDIPAKGAWRYRDYLVRAFNGDVPFDQLVREHLAGDLLPTPRIDVVRQINESRLAPMFYQMGEKRHGDSSEFDGIHQEMLDNKIDAFSKTFLGLTVACARCHDHKIDPILQSEYYALAGVFMSSRWVSNTVDLPARHASARSELQSIKKQLRPLLAKGWKEQAAALTTQALRERRQSRGEAELPLEDLLHPWANLQQTADAGGNVADAWKALAERYRTEHATRSTSNATHFAAVADFRDGVPAGWSVDGVGLQAVVPRGDFTIAGEGEAAIDQVLLGGLVTHSLSPRMNGAVRTPLLNTFEPGHLSFEVSGGDFAARRAVIDNAFLTEKQQYVANREPQWTLVDTFGGMRERRIYLEFATKTSNPNFPPRVGLGGACSEEQAADPRSWFALSRVVRHQAGATPVDELGRFLVLFEGDAPASLDDVSRRYAAWLQTTIDAWSAESISDEQVRLLNAALDAGLLARTTKDTAAQELVARYRDVERSMPTPETVNGMADVDPGIDVPLNIRGDYDQFGPPAPRGFLSALPGGGSPFSTGQSGRLQLAELVASPANPLTARVYVNRVWQWLFGKGLVATSNDFGHLGETPSHAELLDYLAVRFVQEGWSTKRLVREIVLSETWQQSGVASEQAANVDPVNRLLSHYPLRRIEAEAIRDAMLAASGELDLQLYGLPVDPHRVSEDDQKRLFSGPLDGTRRRSIYTKLTIMEPPRLLALFNQPPPKIPTGVRDVTNTPAQSLALLNDPLVNQQAEQWAKRLIEQGPAETPARLDAIFVTAYGRPPSQEELTRWQQAVVSLAELHGVAEADRATSLPVWKDVAHLIFNTKEFIYVK